MNIALLYIADSSILGASPSHLPGIPNGYIPVTSVTPVSAGGASANSMYVYANLSCDFGTEGASIVTKTQILSVYNLVRQRWEKVNPGLLAPPMQSGGPKLGKWQISGLTPGNRYQLYLSGTAYWEGDGEPWNLSWDWVQPTVAR
jgi:hypothetical protein